MLSLNRIPLQVLIFVVLAGFGTLPLLLSSLWSVGRNRDLLVREQTIGLSRNAEQLSERLALQLTVAERQLDQLKAELEVTGPRLDEREIPAWLRSRLASFARIAGHDFVSLVADVRAESDRVYRPEVALDPTLERAIAEEIQAPRGGESRPSIRFVATAEEEPWFLISRQTEDAGSRSSFLLLAAVPMVVPVVEGQEIFLLEPKPAEVLWSAPSRSPLLREAVATTPTVRDALLIAADSYSVLEYELRVGAAKREMVAQLSRIPGTPWVLLVQTRQKTALAAAATLVRTASLAVLLTVVLASVIAAAFSRLISRPIGDLVVSTQEIAEGRFGGHVTAPGMSRELRQLTHSFNAMSDHVADHVSRLRAAARENRELFLGSVRALLRAVEAKEPNTRGHSERVASYCRAMAPYFHDEAAWVDQLWLAGLMHDIGKIGIEDRVLKKGDELTAEEYDEIKKHPVIGAEIMSSIEQLSNIVPAIRNHHERWAGGGYPDGLRGEDIPLIARIVAVADTFDAVTTQRTYQDPYSPEEAVAIIRRLQGKSFDPRAVGVFLQAYLDGRIELAEAASRQRPRPARHASSTDDRVAMHT